MSKRQRGGKGKSAHAQQASAEAKQTVLQLNPAFRQRFGAVGEALAGELTLFSLDLVGLVAAYIVCGPATVGAKPQLLWSREVFVRPCYGITASPDCSQIWCTSEQRMAVLDNDGKYLRSVEDDEIGSTHGIAFGPGGEVFVGSFSKRCVVVLGMDGSVKRTIGSHGKGDGRLGDPFEIAVKGDLLFVADCVNCRIVVFAVSGGFVRSFGSAGDGGGQFGEVWGLAVSPAGEIFVGDNIRERIQVFDLNGTFLRKFCTQGSGPGQLSFATGMGIDRAGNLLVSDDGNHRVQILTPQGSFITEFGLSKASTFDPQCVHVDRDGRILVGDESGSVHVFAFPV